METSICYPLINQIAHPGGFWCHAASLDFCKRIDALRNDCGPSEFNGVAPVVVTPALPGPGVRINDVAASTLQTPALPLSASAAIVSPSSEVLPVSAFQDTRKTGASSLGLGAPLCGQVIGNGASGKSSNLDLTGRIVKRGALVSWHGLRFTVSKVRMGTCYSTQPAPVRYVSCNSVQVVA